MPNYDELRLYIQNSIKGNGNKEITGFLLQAVLLYMVDVLGDSITNTDLSLVLDTVMSNTSQNAVQNKVIKAYIDAGDNLIKEEIEKLKQQAGADTPSSFYHDMAAIVSHTGMITRQTREQLYNIFSYTEGDDISSDPAWVIDTNGQHYIVRMLQTETGVGFFIIGYEGFTRIEGDNTKTNQLLRDKADKKYVDGTFFSQAQFDQIASNQYVVGNVAYQTDGDTGLRRLSLSLGLRIQNDIDAAVNDRPDDNGNYTNGLVTALGVKNWVEGKGYLTSAAMNGYATKDDIKNFVSTSGGTITGNLKVIGGFRAESQHGHYVNFDGFSLTANAGLKVASGYSLSLAGEGITAWEGLKTKLGLGSLAYKNSVAFSDIGSKPTTLSGYDITDAVKAGSGFSPTDSDSINIIGYSGIGEGWPAGGPAMRWGTVGYYARLQVEMASDDNPTIYISKVVNNSAFGWAQVLTDKNFDLFGIANKSNDASGSANDILTSSVNGVVERLTDVPIRYGNLLTFAPRDAFYQSQLIINYQSEMAIRGKSGSWYEWAKVMTDKNFASYGVKTGKSNTTGSVNDIVEPSIVGDVESLQNMPFHYCNILTITTTPHYYVGQIAIDYAGRMASRGKTGSTWSAWRTILDTNNIGTTSLPSINLNGETINSWANVRSNWGSSLASVTNANMTIEVVPRVKKEILTTLNDSHTITFNLTVPANTDIEWIIVFKTGSTVPRINIYHPNATLTWQNKENILNKLSPNTTYRIHIDHYLAMYETF